MIEAIVIGGIIYTIFKFKKKFLLIPLDDLPEDKSEFKKALKAIPIFILKKYCDKNGIFYENNKEQQYYIKKIWKEKENREETKIMRKEEREKRLAIRRREDEKKRKIDQLNREIEKKQKAETQKKLHSDLEENINNLKKYVKQFLSNMDNNNDNLDIFNLTFETMRKTIISINNQKTIHSTQNKMDMNEIKQLLSEGFKNFKHKENISGSLDYRINELINSLKFY